MPTATKTEAITAYRTECLERLARMGRTIPFICGTCGATTMSTLDLDTGSADRECTSGCGILWDDEADLSITSRLYRPENVQVIVEGDRLVVVDYDGRAYASGPIAGTHYHTPAMIRAEVQRKQRIRRGVIQGALTRRANKATGR